MRVNLSQKLFNQIPNWEPNKHTLNIGLICSNYQYFSVTALWKHSISYSDSVPPPWGLYICLWVCGPNIGLSPADLLSCKYNYVCVH